MFCETRRNSHGNSALRFCKDPYEMISAKYLLPIAPIKDRNDEDEIIF